MSVDQIGQDRAHDDGYSEGGAMKGHTSKQLAFRRERIVFVINYVKECMEEEGKSFKILDMACSDGSIGEELCKVGNEVVSLDLPKVAKVANENAGLLCVGADCVSMPFKNECFDIVLSLEIIEHLYEVTKNTLEIRRILKPNGKVIITTPNVGSLRNRLFLLQGVHWQHAKEVDRQGHVGFFDFYKLDMFLKDNGLQPIILQGATHDYPVPSEPFVEWMDKKFFGWVINFLLLHENKEQLKDCICCVAVKK